MLFEWRSRLIGRRKSKIKNISDVKEFELIDSKANGAGSDGQNSPTIQPSELVKYIKKI